MVNLSPADYTVIALFFVCVLALGFSAKLKADTSVELVAAGRRLSPWLFLATLVTTWYGGVMGTGEFYGTFGLATLTVNGLPYWIAGLLFALFMAARVREAEQISLPERMDRCYGRTCGLLVAVLVLFLATPASYQFMLGTLIGQMTGIPLLPALLIGGVIGTLFLYRGGLLADAKSNIISFVMMYLAFFVILAIAISRYGAPWSVIPKLPPDQRTWDAGKGGLYVLSWIIVGGWTFVDPGFHQRVAAVGSAKAARNFVLAAVGLWVLFDTMTTLTAMYGTLHLHTDKPLGAQLFPAFGDSVLPPILKGMFFAGMLGAILAATVGYTFVSATTLGRDIVGRLKPNATEHQLNVFTRYGIAVAALGGIALAYWAQSVVTLWYDIPSIVIPGLVVPIIGAYAFKRPPAGGIAVACTLAGSGSAFAWFFYNKHILETAPPLYDMLTPIVVGLAASLLVWGIGSAIADGRRTNNAT